MSTRDQVSDHAKALQGRRNIASRCCHTHGVESACEYLREEESCAMARQNINAHVHLHHSRKRCLVPVLLSSFRRLSSSSARTDTLIQGAITVLVRIKSPSSIQKDPRTSYGHSFTTILTDVVPPTLPYWMPRDRHSDVSSCNNVRNTASHQDVTMAVSDDRYQRLLHITRVWT